MGAHLPEVYDTIGEVLDLAAGHENQTDSLVVAVRRLERELSGKTVAIFDDDQEVQRALYLVHRDLCRVLGNIVIAQERVEADEHSDDDDERPTGRQRQKAHDTLRSAPQQAVNLRKTQRALQKAVLASRRGIFGQ
jgi:hypothetical protein